MEETKRHVVGIIMGSDSDLPVMRPAVDILERFGIVWDMRVVSAHRTPEELAKFAAHALKVGLKAIIAGAGGAAHLPGMMAANTVIPVIGVPIKSSNSIDGWDSILSILQMPTGVPVATVALNASANAALVAVQIIGTSDFAIQAKLQTYKNELQEKVANMNAGLGKKLEELRTEKEKK